MLGEMDSTAPSWFLDIGEIGKASLSWGNENLEADSYKTILSPSPTDQQVPISLRIQHLSNQKSSCLVTLA